jgi:hypothetical protein
MGILSDKRNGITNPSTTKSGGILAKKREIRETQDKYWNEKLTPKIDTSSMKMFVDNAMQAKQIPKATIGVAQANIPKPKTQIDQRLQFGGDALKNDSRSYIGMNIIPAYEEDSTLAKVGKGIVNYGVGGVLSAVGNVGGAAQQALMQTTRAGANLIQGKPQDFSEMTFGKDILGAKEDNLLTQAAATLLDPTTYIGGGVFDDLSRAGVVGKGVTPGTAEYFDVYARRGQEMAKQQAKAAKAAAKIEQSNIDKGIKDNIGSEISRTTTQPTQAVQPVKAVDNINTRSVNEVAKKGTQEVTGNVAENMDIPSITSKMDAPNSRIYGEQPKGNIPDSMRERGISRNVRTDEAMPDDIRTSFDKNPLGYNPDTNPETLARAQSIASKGEEAATAEFYKGINEGIPKPEMAPLAKLLAKQASEAGNTAKAREILSELAVKMTEAGQFSQAAKILREADPETFIMTIDKQIRKLNEQGLKQYGKKWSNVDLLPDEIKAIQDIPIGNQQAYDEVWEQIGTRIARQLPSTGMEKFDAWRRMAMLLNPKTHIRNTVGNVIMSGMRKVSDTLGAGLEKLARVKTGERTKSFGWSFNKDLVDKVNKTWDTVKGDVLGSSRWEIDNLRALGREKNTFKNPVLQGVNEFSLKTLNAEDNIFTKRAFKDALGQYMQANRLVDATNEAIEYATRRAYEATFKQANMLSDFISRAKQVKGVGKLVEGAIPFSKTPANIAARAIEYSPLGLVKALYNKAAGKTAATVIEDLSKGLTGSAITALGYYLGVSGWAKVERNRSDKAEGLMQEMGDQPNSIITPQGSYTFDWAQPFAVPFAMGIAASEAIKNRKDGDTLAQAVWDGIMAGGDTIFNMTMMQNIKNMFSGGSISENIAQIPVSYLEQAIPSLSGQVARTVDDTRRSTYDPNRVKQEWNRVKSRVPGLSQTLEPALDIWGNEQSNGGWIQQFINPGYAKDKSTDAVTNEVARLYSGNKDNDMLLKVAPKTFSADNIQYQLTPQQLTSFQRKMGQENHADIGRLISSAEYKKMTDKQKIKEVKKIVNDNYEDAKDDIIKASALKSVK